MTSDILQAASVKLFCLPWKAGLSGRASCKPTETVKMGGKVETPHPLENWPSLMPMNCPEPITRAPAR